MSLIMPSTSVTSCITFGRCLIICMPILSLSSDCFKPSLPLCFSLIFISHCSSQMVDGAVITYLIGNKTEHYLDLVDSLTSLHIHFLARLPYPVVRYVSCHATPCIPSLSRSNGHSTQSHGPSLLYSLPALLASAPLSATSPSE